jgi:spermidine/putrescine ABC transporter ATP-binding subunit
VNVPGSPGGLVLDRLTKTFDGVVAVRDMSVDVHPGEFVCLLGPSGCGKTTTLRMISGFEFPDSGAISLGGEDITAKPANRRNIGMVFQHYALFPHLTVRDNVAFGLEMRRLPRREIDERVARAVEAVRLTGLERRYPKQLSGGQQQRAALARAIVIGPQLLLLDEPLSNLDAKLRVEMRIELKLIQRDIGTTTLFVTHDQEEALTVADRMVLMNHGEVVQVGTPTEVYERPASTFVASFLGQENFFQGVVTESSVTELVVRTDDHGTFRAGPNALVRAGDRVLLVLKKERLSIAKGWSSEGVNTLRARVEFVNYLGSSIQYLCGTGDRKVLVSIPSGADAAVISANDEVTLTFAAEDCLCLPGEAPA